MTRVSESLRQRLTLRLPSLGNLPFSSSPTVCTEHPCIVSERKINMLDYTTKDRCKVNCLRKRQVTNMVDRPWIVLGPD